VAVSALKGHAFRRARTLARKRSALAAEGASLRA
jgi:hypothetical protein